MSLIWLEIVLGFGAPLAWGLWELYALRRDRRAAAARAAAAPQPRAAGAQRLQSKLAADSTSPDV